MSLQSLATIQQTKDLTGQIAALYDYIANEVEIRIVNLGNAVPPVERQSIPWVRTSSAGYFDAVYVYVDNNWYTRMPLQVNTICIFPTSAPLGVGWEAVQNGATGITFGTGFEARKFSGTGLIIVENFAYRRFDQALTI
jgi:hypothetical protein